MVERLTDDEMRRIRAFANTPAYARDPEQLLPEGAETGSSDETGDEEPRLATASTNGSRTHRRR